MGGFTLFRPASPGDRSLSMEPGTYDFSGILPAQHSPFRVALILQSKVLLRHCFVEFLASHDVERLLKTSDHLRSIFRRFEVPDAKVMSVLVWRHPAAWQRCS